MRSREEWVPLMEAIEKLLQFAEKHWGISGRRAAAASLPIIVILSYFAIYEALHGIDLFGKLWAHAITLGLILGTAWILFAPRLLAEIDRRDSAVTWSLAVLVLTIGVLAFMDLSRTLLDRMIMAAMLAFVVLLTPTVVPADANPAPSGHGADGWMRSLVASARRQAARFSEPTRIVAGIGVVALLTLSLPEGITWIKTPSPTADDKIGIWIAEFEGDEANDTQRSLMTAIESVAFEDPALAELVEIRALPRVVALEGPRTEYGKAAEEARSEVKAGLLMFGTYSKAQANIYTAVSPELIAFSPFFLIPMFPEVRIDRASPVNAIYVVAKYITSIVYFERRDCTNSRRQLQAALDRAENNISLKDVILFDEFHVSIAQGVACEASSGFADREGLRRSIGRLEQIVGSAATPNGDAQPAGDLDLRRQLVVFKAWVTLGSAYRILSRFKGEPAADHLGRAIRAYEQGLTVLSIPPALELTTRSSLGVAYEKLSEQSDRVPNLVLAIAEYARANALSLCKEAGASSGLALRCAALGNNLGVALQKLAQTDVEPVANLKQAINAYAGATARLSKAAPGERSLYALYRSNLADTYRLLAAYEERDANLLHARQVIEDSFAVVRTSNDPDTFGEVVYKFGQIEMTEAADTPDDAREVAGVAHWACSLVVLDRLHQSRAAIVAHDLNAVRKRVGDSAFVQKLGAHTSPPECRYAPADIPRLIAAYE